MVSVLASQLLLPQIGVTTLGLLISATLPAAILLCIQIIQYVIHDYRDFLSLGPGGTPSTPAGYLRIKFLSLFALKDPYSPAPIPMELYQQMGYISNAIPARVGERPTVRGIAPHRQINQQASEATFMALRARIVGLAGSYPDVLLQKTSCLEKNGPGLFTKSIRGRPRRCGTEVCHAHPSDGSLHLTLHPADAAMVMKAGWGELHPLGSGGWLQRFVPNGFIMVYAPRNDSEVEIVMNIIKASVWWIGGIDIDCSNAKVNEHPELSVEEASCCITSV